MVILNLLLGLGIASAQQNPEVYLCRFAHNSSATVRLEEAFSQVENMRMGSIEISDKNVSEHWDARIYQFLMPDHDRYVQMWYSSQELRVDAQLRLASDNAVFAATLQRANAPQASLLCRRNK